MAWYTSAMKTSETQFNAKQLFFKEMFVGTLIYAAVLGFFNDYTAIVEAASFSTLFLAAILLQLLTFLTFSFKQKIVGWVKGRQGFGYRFLHFFLVWLVMFLSKFVFIWSVDFVFGDAMTIYGFFGVLYLVVAVTVIHSAANYTFRSLGKTSKE